MGKRRRRGKSNRSGTKISYDGLNFSSGLERYCYMKLKENGLFEGYEQEVFVLWEGFDFQLESWERTANGKGEFKMRGKKKILPISYTPDFTGKDFVIETKGFANESFPLRWKMFKKHIQERYPKLVIYKPQTQKEVDRTIQLILQKREDEN